MDETPTAPSEDDRQEPELVYRRTDDETAAESVIAAVSELTDTEPERMEPLFRVVDPEALNALCDHDSSTEQADARVTFQFNGCAVAVCGDGRTEVSRPGAR